ncbi:YfzA family protein [Alkalihalobacillus trypoxylicola]|uniref:YfzA-like protein n=1 Tax=Alkalihalobacillus trypoxylicola TaxID=519424 RepID=A0A161PDK2_9BACI|nr:YfzA family protein [Alkalihalobacillus trypoxylicola]KYG26038.1 hypothetical protein AZF04_13210 [Alkalihalobacillus trypoxylicola]
MAAEKKKRKKIQGWVLSIWAFAILQIFFIIIEFADWSPNLRELKGTILGTLAQTTFFEEWFNLYTLPQLNVVTVIFTIILLPYAINSAVKDYKARKEK